jgi:predicted dehydrogenase
MAQNTGNTKNNGNAKDFGWCFIGSGSITHRVMRDVPYTDGGFPASVYSRNFEHASAFAAQYGARAYHTAEEAMSDPDVKAVYVATPHPLHKEFSLMALRRGLPVLCEKPVSISYDDALEIIEAAKANDTYFMEGMWTRHNPVNKQVIEWVRSGRIGAPRALSADFAFYKAYDPASRLYDAELYGGGLLDVGIYTTSFSRFIFPSPPKEVRALASFAPNGVDDRCAVLLQYEDGAITRMFFGISATGPQDATISGESGHIVVPKFWAPKSATLHTADGDEVFEPGFESEGFQYEFNAAMEDIRAGRKENALVTHADTLAAMEIIERVRREIAR